MECSSNVETHHIYSSIHTHQRLRLHTIEKRSGNRIVVSDIEPLSNVNHTLTVNTNTHTTHMIHLPKRFHPTHTVHSRQLLLVHRHSIPTNTHTTNTPSLHRTAICLSTVQHVLRSEREQRQHQNHARVAQQTSISNHARVQRVRWKHVDVHHEVVRCPYRLDRQVA